MTAANTAREFANLMEYTSLAGPVEGRAIAARKVQWYLTQTPYWGGPPPTLAEARKAAKRAWGDKIPDDVAAALSEQETRP